MIFRFLSFLDLIRCRDRGRKERNRDRKYYWRRSVIAWEPMKGERGGKEDQDFLSPFWTRGNSENTCLNLMAKAEKIPGWIWKPDFTFSPQISHQGPTASWSPNSWIFARICRVEDRSWPAQSVYTFPSTWPSWQDHVALFELHLQRPDAHVRFALFVFYEGCLISEEISGLRGIEYRADPDVCPLAIASLSGASHLDVQCCS